MKPYLIMTGLVLVYCLTMTFVATNKRDYEAAETFWLASGIFCVGFVVLIAFDDKLFKRK